MNQYADTAEPFAQNVLMPHGVLEAYMDMQANRLAEQSADRDMNTPNGRLITALFTQDEKAFTDAYSAGYEQARRCAVKGCNPKSQNLIGTRSLTGIRFASGVASLAFSAGINAFCTAQNL